MALFARFLKGLFCFFVRRFTSKRIDCCCAPWERKATKRTYRTENKCVLFTDLIQSTDFYRRVGDEAALRAVHAHFDFINYWLETSGGMMLKSVGDAVIGVFSDPLHGVQAAVDILSHWEAFNGTLAPELRLEIRIGIHFGPVVVVLEADHLDLFGNTMNLASRFEPHSRELGRGRDFVVSEDVINFPAVKEAIQRRGFAAEPFFTTLKGHGGATVYSVHSSLGDSQLAAA